MADAMVDIDHRFDNLKLAAKFGFRTPPAHPDIDARHEALQLWEKLYELGRSGESTTRPAGFATLLAESEAGARELKDALAAWTAASPADAPPAAVDKAMSRVAALCTACHKTYRD
jgi:cytochrome c556